MSAQVETGVVNRKRLQDDRVGELLDIAAEVFIAEGFAAASTNRSSPYGRTSEHTTIAHSLQAEDAHQYLTQAPDASMQFGQVSRVNRSPISHHPRHAFMKEQTCAGDLHIVLVVWSPY